MIIWSTELSNSGKNTINSMLKNRLGEEGYDGDEVRKELQREPDFSRKGILKNSFELNI